MFAFVILSKKKEAFPALSFKDHLDLTDRLEIAAEYLKRGGFYGVVIDLANAYNTNRQRVYDILDAFQRLSIPSHQVQHPNQGKPWESGLLS